MTALFSMLLVTLFPAAVIVAAIRDVTTITIPNWISLAIIAAFLPMAVLAHAPLGALEGAAIVGASALALSVIMFALGWVGGGDAKLFAACALWLGWPALMPFLLWTSVAGGCLSVALLWSRKLASSYPGMGPAWFGRLMQPGGDVPYGLAIAVGALMAFPQSVLVHAAL
jgi:prepilin peptidase CpaA